MSLSYHGKSKEVCEYVIKTFDKPQYSDNMSIQLWVKESKIRLEEIKNV